MSSNTQSRWVKNRLISRSIFICLIFFTSVSFFPPIAFAKNQQNPPPPAEDVSRAGVSVVRLLAFYSVGKTTDKASPKSVAECTGLGVLLSSQLMAGTNKYENWVLTDGSLVTSENQATCLDTSPIATLSHVDIYVSNAYNSNTLTPFSTINGPKVVCRALPAKCSEGPALFSFQSDFPQPFIDFPSPSSTLSGSTALAPKALQLISSDKNVKILNPSDQDAAHVYDYRTQVQTFLQPNTIAPTSNRLLESGTPLVDNAGALNGLFLSNASAMKVDDILRFVTAEMNKILGVSNPVHDNWKSGMDAYYITHSMTEAYTDFTRAFDANPQFEAAQKFAVLSTQTVNIQTKKADNTSTTQNPSLQNSSFQILVFAFVFLLVIIVSLFFLFRRLSLRRQRYALAADFTDAEHHADFEAQGTAEMEANRKQAIPDLERNTFFNQQNNVLQPPPLAPPIRRCPQCGESVRVDANFCPNCRLVLQPPLALPTTPNNEVRPPIPVQGAQLLENNTSSLAFEEQNQPVSQNKQDTQSKLIKPQATKIEQHTHTENIGSRAGQRLGNYRIIRLLGQGGFADVYLGEHIFLKTNAAIKLLNKQLANKAVQGFLAEARTIARLTHPHIIRILEFGVEGPELDLEQSQINIGNSTPYLIMEYASGGTLRKPHPKGTQVPLTTVTKYISQVAEALQYAHDEKLIHRDIKPENMLIGRNHDILLSDFGIATIAHSEHSMVTQELAGTIPYTAPEQFQGKPQIASDQYSLAIVVYEWLCGERPFKGANQWEIINQHMSVPPPSLCQKVTSIPPMVEQVVIKALAKDPQQRFTSITDFAKALSQAQ